MTETDSAVTAAELDYVPILRGMARDGDGYFAQHDIKRLDRAADQLFALRRERDEALANELGLKIALNQAYLYLREHTPADAVSAMWANEIISAMEAIAKKVTSHD
jgi:hypothetical protein